MADYRAGWYSESDDEGDDDEEFEDELGGAGWATGDVEDFLGTEDEGEDDDLLWGEEEGWPVANQDFDAEATATLKPLADQISAICRANNIPFLICIQTAFDPDGDRTLRTTANVMYQNIDVDLLKAALVVLPDQRPPDEGETRVTRDR